MKKISAILLALVLCISVLSIPAFATGDTYTIHVQVPEGSGTPNIWAWGVDGSMPSDAAWPGVAMTADGDWFTFEVPVGTNGMVINTDGDNDKSADITMDGTSDVWVVLTKDDTGHFAQESISYEAPSGSTETPDVPVATPDEPVETPDEPTETPDAPAATPSEGNVLVHAYVPEGTSPCFWAWESASQKNAFTEWPGEAMTKDGDWWIIEVPNWCDGMIVNDGGSGEQTQDITVEAGKEVWIVVNPYDWKASTAYYELPNVDEVIPDEPPVVEVPEVSRPTVGEPAATTAAASKNDKADDVESEDNTVEALGMTFTKKAQALIVLGTALLAIVAIAFALSIPKKIR